MKVGDNVTIGGQEFKIIYMYEDYVLACMANADEETMAASTLVFKKAEDNQLRLIKDKEQIKIVITKLFEEVRGIR